MQDRFNSRVSVIGKSCFSLFTETEKETQVKLQNVMDGFLTTAKSDMVFDLFTDEKILENIGENILYTCWWYEGEYKLPE